MLLDAKSIGLTLRISPAFVLKAARNGELKGFKVGRGWRFTEESVCEWIGVPYGSFKFVRDWEFVQKELEKELKR